VRDPVTGFDYPEDWVSKCRSQDQLADVQQGFSVLTASGTVLRRGYTTGTTAAAACKAAILSLSSEVSSVRITIPCGLELDVSVTASGGVARCRKFAGDYPSDITAGLEFVARAMQQDDGVHLVPGEGIGTFSRKTPRFGKGTPAINPAPLACILQSMQEAIDLTGMPGVEVSMSVPEGAAVATRTLNPRVGVDGGISVLGTTGLVEPWDDHLSESVFKRISAAGDRAVLTTGRTGLRYARLWYPDYEIILIGSKIGDALIAAKNSVVLFGLPALILKYINPHILDGTGYMTIEELAASQDFLQIVDGVLARFSRDYPNVRVVLVNRSGDIIGESP
jgi:cobalt-precorrin-5B (C1)-methyltransferase